VISEALFEAVERIVEWEEMAPEWYGDEDTRNMLALMKLCFRATECLRQI
jgi:hypothetical protein